MITVRNLDDDTQGQLGNQMFRFSIASAYSLDNNVPLVLPDWRLFRYITYQREHKLEDYPHINFQRWFDGQQYVPPPLNMNIDFYHTHQDLRYFDHHRDEILNRFEYKQVYKDMFDSYLEWLVPNWKNLRMAFVHIRRGDTLLPSADPYYYRPDKRYFDDAFSLITYDKCLVFSDDIPWCRDNIIYDNVVYMNTKNIYTVIYLMSMCQTAIIVNSTFSWWGAYLSRVNDMTICTKEWYSNLMSHVDVSHLRRKEWIQV